MRRPIGVTAGAILSMLGGVIALFFAALFVASIFVPRMRPTQTPGVAAPVPDIVIPAVVAAAVAAITIATAIGLFRLRPWARTSIQVLALFVAISCGLAILILTFVRLPAKFSQDTENAFRIGMWTFMGIPFAVSLWILFHFNSEATKAAFTSGEGADPSPRPLSITFIAWSTLVSVFAGLGGVVSGQSGFLLGLTIPGWTARLYYAAIVAVCIYIGKGLLDLRERARIAAIGWSLFSLINAGVLLIPSVRGKLLAVEGSAANPDSAFPVNGEAFLNIVFWTIAIGTLVSIWFLEHHRDTFLRAENSRFVARSSLTRGQ